MKKIALVGNPNVGKSVIFFHLTGIYATVSNYPGTTVEITRGTGIIDGEKIEVIDTPGINSLIPQSEDEKVTLEILEREHPDLVVHVADAKNLLRTLLLTLQLKEMGMPILLDLNMIDEADLRQIEINSPKLENIILTTIVKTTASDGTGIPDLKKAIKKNISNPLDYRINKLDEKKHFQKEATNICRDVQKVPKRKALFLEQLGNFTIRPLTGIPFAFVVLWLLYQFVGIYAARDGVGFMEKVVFGRFINPWTIKMADFFIPVPLIKEFFVGDYGVITMALSYAIAIILPILSAFFLFFAILEDSGYLPRLSILLNKSFRKIGLSGKAVIPMVLGFGCDTMATMTVRTLETERERIIATFLLALAIPCSAQLGVILGMMSSLSVTSVVLWVGIISFIFSAAGYLSSKIIPGRSSDFILEIPPVRIPKLKNILVKTFARIKWYLIEAVPIFILGTAVLFFLDKLSILKAIEHFASPVVVSFLGLPAKATEAFLIGFFRRDYGAAGLYDLSRQGLLNHNQIVVSLVTITLFVPCIAQFLVMIKERGWKAALLIVAFIFPFAFIAGGILNFILNYCRIVL